jgi:putative transposase
MAIAAASVRFQTTPAGTPQAPSANAIREMDPNCVDALEAALADARPEIFNTDQGAQFTATAFTLPLEKSGVAISMDGRGRALDNVFVERLWRTVKYEEVYLREYVDGWKAEESLGDYFDFYCHERPHQALGYRTPAEVYREG